MFTDAPPRNSNRAGFLESDRIKALALPHDARLPAIAESVESAMKAGKGADVRRACADFLKAASQFYQVRIAASACLQRDLCESANGGAQNFSETTRPKPC